MKLFLNFAFTVYCVKLVVVTAVDEETVPTKAATTANLRGRKGGQSGGDHLVPDAMTPESRLLAKKKPQSIVGGTLATSRPWFVQGSGCGGSLIWKDMVLTAAHCSGAFAVGSTVYIGNTLRNTVTSGVETKKVKKFITHPLYSSTTYKYDFALVQLDSPVQSTRTLATYNANPSNPADGAFLTPMGFGLTSWDATTLPNNFYEVTVPKLNDTACSSLIGTLYSKDVMVCTGVAKTGNNTHKGDSGGPVVDRNDVLVGVVSLGFFNNCPASDNNCIPKISAYARVSAASSWISDNICANTAQKPCTCTGTCGANRKVTIKVQHDNYPTETAWSLYRIDGTSIGQQLQGSVTTQNSLVTKDFYLSPGIYKFTISDSDKDGICCGYGNGYFSISSGTTTIYSNNGQFGERLEYKFAVGTTVSRVSSSVVVLHDDYPAETSWTLKSIAGTSTLLSQAQGSIQTKQALVAKSYNLTTGGYRFSIADSDNDGICCDYGRGYFSLDVDQYAVYTYRGNYGAGGYLDFGVVSA